MLIAISVAGLVFGEEAARGEIAAQLRSFMGDQGASAVQGLLVSVRQPSEGIAATTLGVLLLFIGAASGIASLTMSVYFLVRVAVRVDLLWDEKPAVEEMQTTVAVLENRIKTLEGYVWHRAEAEARVKHAIRDK